MFVFARAQFPVSCLSQLREQASEDKWAASGFVCITSEWATSLTAWYRTSSSAIHISKHIALAITSFSYGNFLLVILLSFDVAKGRKYHPDRSIANNPLFIQENIVCKLPGCFGVVGLGYNQPVVFAFCPHSSLPVSPASFDPLRDCCCVVVQPVLLLQKGTKAKIMKIKAQAIINSSYCFMENWQYPGRKCPTAFVNEQSLLSGVLLLSAASSPLFNSALTLMHRWAGFHPRLPPITSVETKAHQRGRPLAVKTKLKWSASTVCVLKSSSFYSLGIFKPATQGVDPRTIELGQHVYTVLLTWHDKANYDTTAPWLPISAPCLIYEAPLMKSSLNLTLKSYFLTRLLSRSILKTPRKQPSSL